MSKPNQAQQQKSKTNSKYKLTSKDKLDDSDEQKEMI